MTNLVFHNNGSNMTTLHPVDVNKDIDITLPDKDGKLALEEDVNTLIENTKNEIEGKDEYPVSTKAMKYSYSLTVLNVGPNSEYKTLQDAIAKALTLKVIITKPQSVNKIEIRVENGYELTETISLKNMDLTGIMIDAKNNSYSTIIVNTPNKNVFDLDNCRGLVIGSHLLFKTKTNIKLNSFINMKNHSNFYFQSDIEVDVLSQIAINCSNNSHLFITPGSGSKRKIIFNNYYTRPSAPERANAFGFSISYNSKFTISLYTVKINSKDINIPCACNISMMSMALFDRITFALTGNGHQFTTSNGNSYINISNQSYITVSHCTCTLTNFRTTASYVLLHVCSGGILSLASCTFNDINKDNSIANLDFCWICTYGVITGRMCKFNNIGRIRTSNIPINNLNDGSIQEKGLNLWSPRPSFTNEV